MLRSLEKRDKEETLEALAWINLKKKKFVPQRYLLSFGISKLTALIKTQLN